MFSIVLMASGPLGEKTWFLGVLLERELFGTAPISGILE